VDIRQSWKGLQDGTELFREGLLRKFNLAQIKSYIRSAAKLQRRPAVGWTQTSDTANFEPSTNLGR
jgi:hypothetical protein